MGSNMGRRSGNSLDLAAVGSISPSISHSQDIGDLDQASVDLNTAPFTTTRSPTLGQYPDQDSTNLGSLGTWYSRNDGPWNGLGRGKGLSFMPGNTSNLQSFTGYRDPLPSECSTEARGIAPSDSGYVSYGAKHSIAASSVCDFDRNTETQSILGELSELSPFVHQPWPQTQPNNFYPEAQSTEVDQNGHSLCPYCDKTTKTKSEMKKHKLRHTKPHKCDHPGCARGHEGFATPNDLSRHKRSCHGDHKAGGKRYRCTIDSCINKDKIWPRADNFRSHIKRTHRHPDVSEEFLDRFVYKELPSTPEVCPDTTAVRSELGANIFPQITSFPNDHSEIWVTLPQPQHLEAEDAETHPPQQIHKTQSSPFFNDDLASHTRSDSSSALTDVQANLSPRSDSDEMEISISESPIQEAENDIISLEQPTMERHVSIDNKKEKSCTGEADINEPTVDHEMKEGQSGSSNSPSSPVEEASHDEMLPEPFEDGVGEKPSETGLIFDSERLQNAIDKEHEEMIECLEKRGSLKKYIETLDKQGILKRYGYCKGHNHDDGRGKKPDPSAQSKCHQCGQCPKSFQRMCELKKHKKRHEKPYGCTSPKCGKKFGSKNDWKRHENTQHFFVELWRCDVQQSGAASGCCGKVVYRREYFKNHLVTAHAMNDAVEQEAKSESCRIGKNCENRFWCGFCEKIVQIAPMGNSANSAWTERFDHIDYHISGKKGFPKVDMDDWKHVDPKDAVDSPDSDDDLGEPNLSPPTSRTAPIPTGSETNASEPNKPRRDTADKRRSKKTPSSENTLVHFCCQCKDQIPDISRVCAGADCQHALCDYCTSCY